MRRIDLTYKTKVAWNQIPSNFAFLGHYTIKFDLTQDTKEEITVEVFDDDIGKDDRLGDTKIPVRQIIQQRNIVNNWIPLKNCKSGEVLFSAEYVELDSQPRPEAPAAKVERRKTPEKPEKVTVPTPVANFRLF